MHVECVYIFSLLSESVKYDNWFRLNCCDWHSLLAYAFMRSMNRNHLQIGLDTCLRCHRFDLWSAQFIEIDFSSSNLSSSNWSWVNWQFKNTKKSPIDYQSTNVIQCRFARNESQNDSAIEPNGKLNIWVQYEHPLCHKLAPFLCSRSP